jgi:hypothetical protein
VVDSSLKRICKWSWPNIMRCHSTWFLTSGWRADHRTAESDRYFEKLYNGHVTDEVARACSTNGGDEEFLWDTGERDRSIGTTACRCVDKIKMDLRDIGWQCMDWIHLVPDTDHWTVLLNAYLKAVKL